MNAQIDATVVAGSLNLDQCIDLPDETRVRVTLEFMNEEVNALAAWELFKARRKLRPLHVGDLHFTREQLHERR